MITQKELKYYLTYDENTGNFYRNVSNNTRHLVGEIAGWLSKEGYKKLSLLGKTYSQHRLAWLYTYGEFPKQVIDHINGNPADNRIVNLRECTRNQNNYNCKLRKDSSSKIKNVKWNKFHKKWQVAIRVDKKEKHMGYFDDEELAELVAIEARERYHKEFARHN